MFSFTERMQAGRDNTQWQRNLGRPQGLPAKGWNVAKPANFDGEAGTWEYLANTARRGWRDDVQQIRVDFAAACLSGPHDPPENWEF